MRRKIVIVKEGSWGGGTGDNSEWANLVKRTIDRNPAQGEEESVEARIVEELADVDLESKNDRMPDVLIFLSRGMQRDAETIKGTHPRMRVVLLSGDPPDEQVVYLDKGMRFSTGALLAAVL